MNKALKDPLIHLCLIPARLSANMIMHHTQTDVINCEKSKKIIGTITLGNKSGSICVKCFKSYQEYQE